MTKNQIDALKNLEAERHNKEQERIDKILIPAQYISSIGSLARGVSGFLRISGGKSNASRTGGTTVGNKSSGSRRGYSAPHLLPTKWTIQ
jgi:hypothetical protein